MSKRFLTAIAVLIVTSACSGGDSTGPKAATYENIAGTYNGSIVGLTQGVALNAIFSLTFTQNVGTLGGTYSISGTLNDGIQTVQIVGTGPLNGTIAAGNNPSINMTITVPGCSTYRADFSGAYDSANKRITLTGPIDILNTNCAVVLRYNTTIILNR